MWSMCEQQPFPFIGARWEGQVLLPSVNTSWTGVCSWLICVFGNEVLRKRCELLILHCVLRFFKGDTLNFTIINLLMCVSVTSEDFVVSAWIITYRIITYRTTWITRFSAAVLLVHCGWKCLKNYVCGVQNSSQEN